MTNIYLWDGGDVKYIFNRSCVFSAASNTRYKNILEYLGMETYAKMLDEMDLDITEFNSNGYVGSSKLQWLEAHPEWPNYKDMSDQEEINARKRELCDKYNAICDRRNLPVDANKIDEITDRGIKLYINDKISKWLNGLSELMHKAGYPDGDEFKTYVEIRKEITELRSEKEDLQDEIDTQVEIRDNCKQQAKDAEIKMRLALSKLEELEEHNKSIDEYTAKLKSTTIEEAKNEVSDIYKLIDELQTQYDDLKIKYDEREENLKQNFNEKYRRLDAAYNEKSNELAKRKAENEAFYEKCINDLKTAVAEESEKLMNIDNEIDRRCAERQTELNNLNKEIKCQQEKLHSYESMNTAAEKRREDLIRIWGNEEYVDTWLIKDFKNWRNSLEKAGLTPGIWERYNTEIKKFIDGLRNE